MPEQDDRAGEVEEAEAVLSLVLIADHQAAEVVEPSEEPLEIPAAPVAPERPAILGAPTSAIASIVVGRNRPDPPLLAQSVIGAIAIVGLVPDEPGRGVPRTVTDAAVEQVVRWTLETPPKAATHWSTRAMAKRAGLSQSTVSRISRAFGLQPDRTETFKLSADPLFIEKVRDIVGLYLNPPDCALVLCVDEKGLIQALDRTRPLLPLRPGQVERRTHDDVRHGTTSLFAALEVKTGAVLAECHRRHRAVEFRRFLDRIDAAVPAHLDIHLIVDNASHHKTALIRRWLAKRPRYHVHFTPTGASWLNLVERWFALLTERQLRRGVHRSTQDLEEAIYRYTAEANIDPKPFIWSKTVEEILAAVARFCQRTSNSGH